MHVGIVGYGAVGRALGRFFARSESLHVRVYDTCIAQYASLENLLAVDRCDIVFVAVPTPYDEARQTCNTSIVEEIIDTLSSPVCIKSTIPPGTTDALIARTGKPIAFSPEYIGESPGHPWLEIDSCGFVVLSGDQTACGLARKVYETVALPDLRYFQTTALTAELGKYMENSYLAWKVSFVNQFYDLAVAAGIDFAELREMFLLDSRVGESHTQVSPERGFGGKCLPKDLRAIAAWARQNDCQAALIEAIVAYNERIRAAQTRSGGEASAAAYLPMI